MARPVHVLFKLVAFAAIPCAVAGLAFGLGSSHPTELARETAADTDWIYVVRDGDVLTRIAQAQLGTFRRYDEIVALNPDVKEHELTVGTALRMPPRESHSAAPQDVPAPDAILLWLALGLVLLVGLVVVTASRLERHGFTRRA